MWFKLELDPSHLRSGTDLASRYPPRNELPPAYDPDVRQLVVDYFTALREHTERYLKNKVSNAVLNSTPIEYIIT